MKIFVKMAAALLLTTALLPLAFGQTSASAASVTTKAKIAAVKANGHKGGYVHATTFTTKAGKVVHRKGFYRHSTKMKAASAKKSM